MDAVDTAVDAALAHIDAQDHVTPWEALRSTGLDVDELRGEWQFGFEKRNIWVAVGLSEMAMTVLSRVADQRSFGSTSLLVYVCEGDLLPGAWPMARRPPRDGYKHPHFAPIVFRSVHAESD